MPSSIGSWPSKTSSIQNSPTQGRLSRPAMPASRLPPLDEASQAHAAPEIGGPATTAVQPSRASVICIYVALPRERSERLRASAARPSRKAEIREGAPAPQPDRSHAATSPSSPIEAARPSQCTAQRRALKIARNVNIGAGLQAAHRRRKPAKSPHTTLPQPPTREASDQSATERATP